MDDGAWGGIVGFGVMLLIAPTALTHAGHRARRIRRGEVRAAMTQPLPEAKLRRGPILLGLALAGAWAAVWVVVSAV